MSLPKRSYSYQGRVLRDGHLPAPREIALRKGEEVHITIERNSAGCDPARAMEILGASGSWENMTRGQRKKIAGALRRRRTFFRRGLRIE